MTDWKTLTSQDGFDLQSKSVGSFRYFRIWAVSLGKQAVSWTSAPCKGAIRDVRAAFATLMAQMPPDLAALDELNPTAEHRHAVTVTMRGMFERTSPTEYALCKIVPPTNDIPEEKVW